MNIAYGWELDVERGAEWLFLRPRTVRDDAESEPPLAEMLWSAAEQHGIHRLIIELDDLPLLSSYLVGQLVIVHKRVGQSKGVLRLCGLSSNNHRVIEAMQLAGRLPSFPTREEAAQ